MATLETQRVGDLGGMPRGMMWHLLLCLQFVVQDIRGWADSVYISVLPGGLWVQLVEDKRGGWGWGVDDTSVHPRKRI